MINKLFILLLILCFFIFLVAGYFFYQSKQPCRNLKKIMEKEDLTAEIWRKATFYFNHPIFLSSSRIKSGPVFANKIENHFEIDWERLGIPLEYATLEVRGIGIDYGDIKPYLVDEVRVGYGYRAHLVYKLKKDNDAANYPVDSELIHYDLSVECSG